MAYGTIKVDTITFTDAGVDKSVTISGLVQNPTFTGNVTVTGTISGNTVRGQTISGVTVTGTTANFTSGNFTNISGGTHTITSGVFALGTAANPSISFVSDPNSGLYSPGADQVAISTNGTGRLFVDSSGRVSVGTATANAPLTVAELGVSGAPVFRFVGNAGNSNYMRGSWFASDNTTPLAQLAVDGVISMSLGTISSTPLVFTTVNTERMRLDSSGRLGLGTSSPAARLEVNNSLAGTSEQIRLTNTNTTGVVGSSIFFKGFYNTALISSDGQPGASPGGNLRLQTYSDDSTLNTGININRLGNVGIGTSSPSYLLHVSGSGAEIGLTDTAVANATWRLLAATGGATKLFRIYDSSNAADRFVIDSSGRVGIGTTSPAAGFGTGVVSLDVVGPIFARGPIATHQTNAGVLQYSAGTTLIRSYGATAATGEIAFNTGGGGGSPDTERARIDSSGRLLVGTSTSEATRTSALQVVGSGFAATQMIYRHENNADGATLYLGKNRGTAVNTKTIVQSGDSIGEFIWIAADGTADRQAARIGAEVDGTPGANDMPGRLVFSTTADGATSPTERMRIASTGDVYFGTTTVNPGIGNTATGTLIRNGTADSDRYIAVSRNAGAGLFVNRNTNDGSVCDFARAGTSVGTISVTASATAYNTSSDYRLKENVIPLTGAADRLKLIPVHRFNFIADPDTTVDGFIAHEAQAVVPECVTGAKDEVDDDGNPVYQGIDQSKLVPLLTAALQEALTEIESLKARVTALEP